MIFQLLDYVNLAATLNSQGRYHEAIAACRLGLEVRRDLPRLLAQLGRAALGLENTADAIAACEAALQLDPACLEAHLELAFAHRLSGDRESALAAANAALAIDAESEHAHCVLATLLLWDGDLREGLREQEWHWRREAELLEGRFGAGRRWDGAASPALRLLVAHEQGYGDLFHAARFLRHLRERAGYVILECAPDAADVLRFVAGVDEIVVKGGLLPAFDAYVRLMSVPAMFVDDLPPVEIPYIRAEPDRIGLWAQRLDAGSLHVGVAWSGNPAHTNDRDRSLPPDAVAALDGIEGVSLHSLQKSPQLETFADTAAAIAGLDLVISVDTAVAHLAGAMGKPVWLLLGARPDWRWMLEGRDTPWYPATRLFRRPFGGVWDAVLTEVRTELASLAAS
ncbi:MAG TPA: glycosyltransferase family 9 protein [Candidatus Binatia bacterium]|nr:glycosyltransferase family 9 protein [Candidatus Binatia bacterium]